MTDGPLLWFLNRGTGVVLLVLLTPSTVLGVLALAGGRPGRGVPRFVSQSLHRHLALLSVVALVGHVATAVVDTYVDIRWWQAVVPFGATYEPLWLGLGTLSLDLVVVVVATSLLRTRLPHRWWRGVHVLSWLAWAVGVAHGIGIGTDLREPVGWAVAPVAACVAVVGLALAYRAALLLRTVGAVAAGAPSGRRWPGDRADPARGPRRRAGPPRPGTAARHRRRAGARRPPRPARRAPPGGSRRPRTARGGGRAGGRGGAGFPFATKLAATAAAGPGGAAAGGPWSWSTWPRARPPPARTWPWRSPAPTSSSTAP